MDPKCQKVTRKGVCIFVFRLDLTRSVTTGKDIMNINNVFFETNRHKLIQDNMKYDYQIIMNIFKYVFSFNR